MQLYRSILRATGMPCRWAYESIKKEVQVPSRTLLSLGFRVQGLGFRDVQGAELPNMASE